jgi:hypothetical protein
MASGTIVGTASIAQHENVPLSPLSDFSDSVALSASVSSGDWLVFVQVGGWPWFADCGSPGPPIPIPYIAESSVGNVLFEQIQHASFADGGSVSEWNQDVNPIGFLSDPGACPSPRTTAYVDNTYPNLAYTEPSILSAGISSGDSIEIDWVMGDTGIVETYTALVAKITAPFDQAFNEPIWLEGTSFSGAASEGFNSGTTSYPLVTHAANAAAAGKGAICLAAIAWDDTSIVPTLTSGWTMLTNYADTTTGWASLLAGRVFAPGDTSTYTLTATFASSVKSTCMCDTWQTLAGEGLHVWQRT